MEAAAYVETLEAYKEELEELQRKVAEELDSVTQEWRHAYLRAASLDQRSDQCAGPAQADSSAIQGCLLPSFYTLRVQ